ncbi:hypothetical protein BH20BAC1_BH20BAC1_07600 [soil metagenome]
MKTGSLKIVKVSGIQVKEISSYGEISPLKAGTNWELHNQTITITTFDEN